ncbi:MAG: Crp/Fnr family transcriptional regulator [Bacteroidales bacterium]|nr:Crp/Fnr family transcriptional regulator [Bacteroidales bacterium]
MNNHCKICTIKSIAASKLSDAQIEKLSNNCLLLKFHKGDSVIRQGTFSTNVAYLQSGLAKIHIAGPYHEQIVRIVKAPTYLGLPTTFGDKINQYSVTVIEEAEVCFIDISAFRDLLNSNNDFSYEIILELCRNELDLYHKCASRTQKQIRGKIADVLLEFSEKFYNSGIFTIPLNQEDIGNLVDSSRESISRVLTEFEKDGIIKFTGKKIEILNKKSLFMISANG